MVLYHDANLRRGTRLYFPSEASRGTDFYRHKICHPPFKLTNFGFSVKLATTRPPSHSLMLTERVMTRDVAAFHGFDLRGTLFITPTVLAVRNAMFPHSLGTCAGVVDYWIRPRPACLHFTISNIL
jgi:hypothetical protein